MSVSVTVDLSQVEKMMEIAPRVVNTELNRMLRAAARGFYRAFQPRLEGAGITVKRQIVKKKTRGGVPAVARAMGFMARLSNRREIHGKAIEFGTRSPVMAAHEFGATIRASGGRFLALGLPPRPRRKLGSIAGEDQGRLLRLVRQVRIPARLGFYSTWAGYEPQLAGLLERAGRNIVEKVDKALATGKGLGEL